MFFYCDPFSHSYPPARCSVWLGEGWEKLGKGENLHGKENLLGLQRHLTWFYFLHSELSAKSKALQLQVVEDGKLDSKYFKIELFCMISMWALLSVDRTLLLFLDGHRNCEIHQKSWVEGECTDQVPGLRLHRIFEFLSILSTYWFFQVLISCIFPSFKHLTEPLWTFLVSN